MLMSPELFLDCLMYVINDNTDASRVLVRDLIVLFEADSRNTATVDHDITRFYIRILRAIMESGVSKQTPDELRMILLKFQSDAFLTRRQEIYKLLHDTFTSAETLTKEKIAIYAERITNTLLLLQCHKASRTFYGTLAKAGDMANPADQAAELLKLRDFGKEVDTLFTSRSGVSHAQPKSLVEKINLSDKASMTSALEKHQERSVKGVLKLGLHGINRMLGKKRGLGRGESAMFYALPHNYKSGLIMSVAGWVVLYNNPVLLSENQGKKPAVVLFSLENEAYQNAVWMFRHFYETQALASSSHLTNDEVAEWTYQTFTMHGYELIIERHTPNEFNFPTFVRCIEDYEASGYEIVLAALDYPNLMAKDGINQEAAARHDLAVRALISALCNYTKSKGITFVGAHPLNRKAKELAASGITNVVKRLDTSYLSDSFDVAKEVDFEVFMHIERNLDGVYYLTMMRGKHRYVDDTPDAHKYCAYRFHPLGIQDDLTRSPEFVTDIYSDPRSRDGIVGTVNQPQETDVDAELAF